MLKCRVLGWSQAKTFIWTTTAHSTNRPRMDAAPPMWANAAFSASEVLEVVGEGTVRAENGIWIPAGFEFDPLDFHDLSMEQIVDVDWQVSMPAVLSPFFAGDFGESSCFFLIGAGYPFNEGCGKSANPARARGLLLRPELVKVPWSGRMRQPGRSTRHGHSRVERPDRRHERPPPARERRFGLASHSRRKGRIRGPR